MNKPTAQTRNTAVVRTCGCTWNFLSSRALVTGLQYMGPASHVDDNPTVWSACI